MICTPHPTPHINTTPTKHHFRAFGPAGSHPPDLT